LHAGNAQQLPVEDQRSRRQGLKYWSDDFCGRLSALAQATTPDIAPQPCFETGFTDKKS
jgi:hypothetical protein